MNFQIKQPETDDEFKRYFHLRWKILRAPWHQDKGTEIDDIEDQCFHLMAISSDSETIAVARLQFNSNEEAQIRYMAVDEPYQGNGIGRELIKELEQHASNSSCKEVILHARESAVDFYQHLGYKLVENSYLLFDEIQHYLMTKKL